MRKITLRIPRIPRSACRPRPALLVLLLLVCSCGSSGGYKVPALADAGAGTDDAGQPDLPVSGIGSKGLQVTGADPASGPFSGGNSIVVRGSGFSDQAVVRIGGHMVQPSDVMLQGKGRLAIVVPAGKVGAADITVTQGKATSTLTAGYYYNALQLTPQTGSIAGGTQVELTLSGGSWDANVSVDFDGKPCTGLMLLTPKRLRCKTPAHALGAVDVQARWSDAKQHAPVLAKNAFEYVDTSDADLGGLSGGPITGTLNVTVVDSGGGVVLPGAFVIVGNDPKTSYKGLTDMRGAITFSGPDLKGPVTVHASLKCFERGSIVAFDAQNVTIFLSPLLDLSCAKTGNPPPSTPGHGQLGSTIAGELIFPGSDEFHVNNWDIVPKPKPGETRVAYVFTTRSSADARNPAPDGQGTQARLEESTASKGSHGYLYKIFARPAGLAVYALCGLERSDTGEFTPYVMGVARNVVTSPGDETTGIDIDMSITLDRELQLALSHVPAASSTGPDQLRVRAHVDLGGEGVIVRQVQGVSLDSLTRFDPGQAFRFLGEPAFVGALADASFELIAGYYTGTTSNPPFTMLTRFGVKSSSTPILIDDFLGIPQVTAPALGADIPKDRTLRFDVNGPAPDFFVVELIGGDGNPAWQQILPGSARSVPVPDLSRIPGQVDIAEGFITWTVQALKVDGFQYDSFQYSYLSSRYWTHNAENVFTTHR